MLESPFFSLDLQNDRQAYLYEWLKGKDLPKPLLSPEEFPPGLDGVQGVGCKFLEIGGQKSRGSLICYKKNGNVVHLVMMERKAIDGADDMNGIEGAVSGCHHCDKNLEWAVTQWAEAEHVFFLLSKMEPEELAAIF